MDVTAGAGGDFAKRVVDRRESLGLTRDEVARRAGMDAAYLDYLEHSPTEDVTTGALMRLAAALETTPAALGGAEVDRPPGRGQAHSHPRLEVLDKEQCRAHLAPGGIGRVVFLDGERPVALPVNFRLVAGDVIFRSDPAGRVASRLDTTVSFEVDQIDEAMREGWSVIVTGHVRRVEDPAQLEQLTVLGAAPWAGGHRDAVLRIETTELSGRRIRTG